MVYFHAFYKNYLFYIYSNFTNILPVFSLNVLPGAFCFPEHRAPTFTTEPPNKVIFLNSSGESVHCAAMGNPRPTISWVLADGTAVQDLPGLRLALANGTLLFLPFMAESYRQDVHASTYRCIASNLVGKIGSRDVMVRAGKWR